MLNCCSDFDMHSSGAIVLVEFQMKCEKMRIPCLSSSTVICVHVIVVCAIDLVVNCLSYTVDHVPSFPLEWQMYRWDSAIWEVSVFIPRIA